MSYAHSTPELYFSGQGVVLIGRRTATGKPIGLLPVGNVSDLKITNAVSNLEHKESSTGARGTDLRLTTEIKVGVSMTMEKFNPKNLATAMRASNTTRTAGSVSGQELQFSPGAVSPLQHVDVSAVVLTTGTAYVDDNTAWDYRANTQAGSLLWNDGETVGYATLGTAASAVTVGATTTITVAFTGAVGDRVWLYGAAGADAADINGKWHTVATVIGGGTGITVSTNTSGKTITLGSLKAVYEGLKPTVAYSFAEQSLVDALTEASPDYYLRFEGLNTAKDNKPVVVEVFRFNSDPLKELALISDTIQQFVLEGSVLSDPLQSSGSKYYKVLLQDA